MEKRIFLAGYGGQGVQTLGKLLTYAVMETGGHAMFIPAYAGNMRGGVSNCTLVVSDGASSAPEEGRIDLLVALSEAAKRRFEARVASGGTMICNSSMVQSAVTREDISILTLPATELAERCGTDKVMSIVLFAYIVGLLDLVPEEAARDILEEKICRVKPQFAQRNRQAYELGRKAAAEALSVLDGAAGIPSKN